MSQKKLKKIFLTSIVATFALFVLSSCGLLKPLMSDKEIEDRLQELYGEEFIVVSSKSFPTDDAFRARVYVVSPKDEPEFTFYAYSFIEGETGGVPGVRHSFHETYIEQKIQAQIDLYAPRDNIEYATEYYMFLSDKKIFIEKGTEPFTEIINTFIATPETVDSISYKLSKMFNKILEDDVISETMATRSYLRFYYYVDDEKKNHYFTSLFAHDWDSEKKEFTPIDITPEGLKKMIVE